MTIFFIVFAAGIVLFALVTLKNPKRTDIISMLKEKNDQHVREVQQMWRAKYNCPKFFDFNWFFQSWVVITDSHLFVIKNKQPLDIAFDIPVIDLKEKGEIHYDSSHQKIFIELPDRKTDYILDFGKDAHAFNAISTELKHTS